MKAKANDWMLSGIGVLIGIALHAGFTWVFVRPVFESVWGRQ